MFGQRTFFSTVKLVLQGKREIYVFYQNANLKDCVLFKQTLLSIEIDVVVVKKHVFLNFVEKKYVKVKKRKLILL